MCHYKRSTSTKCHVTEVLLGYVKLLQYIYAQPFHQASTPEQFAQEGHQMALGKRPAASFCGHQGNPDLCWPITILIRRSTSLAIHNRMV
jgi:hypothetical protein